METKITSPRFYISYNRIWGILASVFIILNWLDKTNISVQYLGDFSLGLFAVTLAGYSILSRRLRFQVPVAIVIIVSLIGIMIIIYSFGEVFNQIKGIKNVLGLIIIALYFVGAAYVLSNKEIITILATLWVCLAVSNLTLWIVNGFEYPFSGIFSHKNTLGSVVAFGMFFILSSRAISRSKWWWNLWIVINLMILLVSGSRNSWLVIVISIIAYYFWPIFSAKRWLFSLVFIMILIGSIGLVFFYVELSELHQFTQLQAYVLKYTGQNLFTGRQVFWPILVSAIQRQPWGYGPGASLEHFYDTTFSSHNLYLQVMLQAGIVSLVVLGVTLWSIWLSLYNKRKDTIVRLAGSFLLGALVHEAFEVSLTQNNLTVGIIIWSIIAIGVGRASLTR